MDGLPCNLGQGELRELLILQFFNVSKDEVTTALLKLYFPVPFSENYKLLKGVQAQGLGYEKASSGLQVLHHEKISLVKKTLNIGEFFRNGDAIHEVHSTR